MKEFTINKLKRLWLCVLLLVGANAAFADDVALKYASDAATTFTGAPAAGRNVTIDADILLNAPITISDGGTYVVNLNGHTISYATSGAGKGVFIVTHGSLEFTGTGTVYDTAVNEYAAVMLYGSDNPEAENYSVLTVGENVTLQSDYAGIFVNKTDPNASSAPAYGVVVNFNGTIVTPALEDANQQYIASQSKGNAIYINGSITPTTGNVPVFNIGGTINAEGNGIYAAGYAQWNVNSTITSAEETAIEIRAGVLNITGGTYTAQFTPVTSIANGNGSTTSGAAVAVAQHTTNNVIDVNITGGTFNSQPSGAALIVTNPQNNNGESQALVDVSVNGGTFNGPIAVTEDVVRAGGFNSKFIESGDFATDVSTYLATGKGLRSYQEGNVTRYATKEVLKREWITMTCGETGSFVYDGQSHMPTFRVNDGENEILGTTDISNGDWRVVPNANVQVGTYGVRFYEDGDNYVLDPTATAYHAAEGENPAYYALTYRIYPKDIASESITASIGTTETPLALTYNAADQSAAAIAAVVVKDGEETLEPGTDYTVAKKEGDNWTDAGEHILVISGAGRNYGQAQIQTPAPGTQWVGTREIAFTIAPMALNDNMVTITPEEGAYNGNPHSPEYRLSWTKTDDQSSTSIILTNEGDYTVTIPSDMTNVGKKTYVFNARQGGNYTGSAKGYYTITGYEVTINGAAIEKVYGQSDPTAPNFTVDAASPTTAPKASIAPYLAFARQESGEYVKQVPVGNTDEWTIGTYQYYVKPIDNLNGCNYSFTFLQQGSLLKINQRTLNIKLNPQSKVFGQTDAEAITAVQGVDFEVYDDPADDNDGLAENEAIGIDDSEAVITMTIFRETPQSDDPEAYESQGEYPASLNMKDVVITVGGNDITWNYNVVLVNKGDFNITPEPVGDVTITGEKQVGTELQEVINPDTNEPEMQEVPVYETVYEADGDQVVYAGRDVKPVDKWTVRKGDTELVEGTDYEVTAPTKANGTDPVDAWSVGEYTYTFNFKGNYGNNRDADNHEVPTTATLEIIPAPLTITYNGQTVPFGTKLSDPALWDGFTFGVTTQNITENTFVNGEGPDFALAGSTPVIVSEYEYEGASAWKPGYYEEVLNIEGITAVNGNYDITLVAGDLEVKKAQREDVQIQDIVVNYGDSFSPTLVDGNGNKIEELTYSQDIFTYWIPGTENPDNWTEGAEKLDAKPSNVGAYMITVEDEDLDDIESELYKVVYVVPGNLTINKKQATIAAVAKSMTAGGVVPTLEATKSGFVGEEGNDVAVTFLIDGVEPKATYDVGTYPITPVAANADPEKDVLKNYTLILTPANLTVGTGDNNLIFDIIAQHPTYDAKVFNFDAYKAVEGNLDIELKNPEALLAADADKADEITAAVKEAIVWTLAELDPEAEVKNAGTYDDLIKATSAPAGFNYNVTINPADLVIDPYDIEIEIKDQYIDLGDEVDVTPALGVTVNYSNPKKLAGTDKLACLNIKLEVVGEIAVLAELPIKGTWDNTNYNVTFVGNWDNEADDDDPLNEHAGVLYVGQPETALRLERPFLQSKTLWDAQESDRVYDEAETSKFRMLAAEDYIPNTADGLLRAYNNQTTDVVFGDFEMYKNRWYTLVLPFDASVREISAAFGYAQINVLNEAVESNEKIYMKLYNQMIPANTPFMLKIDRDINMNDESIIFEDKTIVYASDDDMYAAAENYEVPAETAVQDIAPLKNAGGTLFVGTYKGKYGKGTNGAVDGLKSNEWITRITNGNFNQGGEGVYCYPLGAYWVLAEDANPANVRLYVEEADGTITAINSVGEEVDDDAASFADGWYTVTGVKLEGEPTVSGTYIYNGQKVYLKK